MATSALTSLPAELQGEAIEKMGPAAFDQLLANMPELDKERFAALVENTRDPERKLRFWAEAEKGEASREPQASRDDVDCAILREAATAASRARAHAPPL